MKESISIKTAREVERGDIVYLDQTGQLKPVRYNKLERFIHRVGKDIANAGWKIVSIGNRIASWREKKVMGIYVGDDEVQVSGFVKVGRAE